MTSLASIMNFTQSLYADWTGSFGFALAGAAVMILLIASLLSFVAAFLGIEKPTLRVSGLAVSGTVVLSLVCAGLLDRFAPGLTSELAPWVLFSICGVFSFVVLAVPLMQAFWHTDYLRASSSFICTLLIVGALGYGLHEVMNPASSQVARPVIQVID